WLIFVGRWQPRDLNRKAATMRRKKRAAAMSAAVARKITAGSFLPQGSLLAAIKEDGSERSLLAALCNERCVLRLKG
ncbi:hypothetical protein BHE74_00044158, partial [Ensete ventricosum]